MKANIWLTTLTVLGIIAVFIIIQGFFMILSQSDGSSPLNISQASVRSIYLNRGNKSKLSMLADLFSATTPKPAAPVPVNPVPANSGTNDIGSVPPVPANQPPAPTTTLTVTFPNQAGSVSRWINNAPRGGYSMFWDGPSVQAKSGTVKINLVAYTASCTTQVCPAANTRYPITAQAPNNGSFTIQPTQFVSPDLRDVPDKVPAGQYVVEVIAGSESDVSDAPFPVVDNPTPDIFVKMCDQFELKPGQRAWVNYGNLNIDRGSDSGDKVSVSSQMGGYQGNTNFRVRYTMDMGQAISVHYAALKFISRNGTGATFEVRPGGTTQVSGGHITQEYVPDFNSPCVIPSSHGAPFGG